jgi:hypothetical protein
MKLNYNLLSEHRMNINRLITFLICFVFIGQAQADKLPVEIWECSKDSTVIVKAKVFKGKRSGSIEVSGVTHETSFNVDGFDRTWRFGLDRFLDGYYGYTFAIDPTGRGAYYEFIESTAKSSLRLYCSQNKDKQKVEAEEYRQALLSQKKKAAAEKRVKDLQRAEREAKQSLKRLKKMLGDIRIEALKVSYINQIAARVREHWRYKGAKDSWGCDVHIMQDAQGNVKSVNVQSCIVDKNTKRKSFRDSIERAVNKASPLPSAPDKGVFDREILFHFRVN